MSKKSKKKSPAKQESVSSITAYDTESITSRVNMDDDDASPENNDTGLKDSLERIDERTDVEKKLYDLISKGDIEAVDELIRENHQDIDINHKNLLGHDILTHAVETRKKKLISLVLTIDPDNVNTEEALLHAIKEDRLGIVRLLLEFEDNKVGGALYAVSRRLIGTQKNKFKSKQKTKDAKVRKRKGGDDSSLSDEESPIALPESFDDTEYGWGITPIMQAAIHGHYEILQELYNRGERLPDFHYPSCACSLCKSATRDLARTQRRINLLKAMCNPTYMIFMAGQDGSYDPVYEAIQLSEYCSKCAKEEPEFSDEYSEIYDSVSKLPADLLTMCRTCDEVKLFLNQKQGYEGPSSMPYQRLATAMNAAHKELVSHPNIQFFLQTEFMGPIWKTPRSDFERIAKIAVTALMMLFFPVVQLFLWFSLFCCSGLPVVRYLLSPMNRALSKLASYIGFCILLFFMNKEQRNDENEKCFPPTIYVRYIVIVYTFALLVGLMRRCMLNPVAFWSSGWNWFDLITQILLWWSYVLWGWMVYQKLECPNRKQLPTWHLILVEECVFAVGSTMATLRLLRWYVLSPYLGPFQAGLHRMSKHTPTVIFFMTWTVLSFSLSSKILFRPYLNLTEFDVKEGKNKSQPKGFTETDALFMDFYVGDIGPDDVAILPVNSSYPNENGEEVFVTNEHKVTEHTAMLMCVLWNIVGVKFLQESVTGLFGSTGAEVLKAKDIEWNYDRAKEMLHYIQDGHLAPPFNLLPHGACMASFFGWIYATTCGKGDSKTDAGCNYGECCYMRDVENPEEHEDKMKEYSILLRNLFMRYFKSKKDEDEAASKENVGEVQDKVKEIRELCKLIIGHESPPKGQSKASEVSVKEKKRVEPNTQPSESISQQEVQNNNDPTLKTKTSTPKAVSVSNQQTPGTNSVQVVVSPKSKSKSRPTTLG